MGKLARVQVFAVVLLGGCASSGPSPETETDATAVDEFALAQFGDMRWVTPVDGATVSGTISLQVAPPSGTTQVIYLVEGTRLELVSSSPWTATFDTRTVPNGDVHLLAKAKDRSGNVIARRQIVVHVANSSSPPVADGGSPTTPDSGGGTTPPPPTTTIVGYGASTVGGNGAPVVDVSSLAQLRTEVARTGPKNLRLQGSGVWDLAGNDLDISRPNLTLDGSRASIVFKGGSFKVTTSQVILRYIRSRAGDQSGVPADLDAITVNGNSHPVDHIVIDHCESMWAPDVAGVFLGAVSDVTVQYSIYGEGLLHSRHPESGDLDGHGLALNIASTDSTVRPSRMTFYADLVTTSQGRQPRVIGGEAIDFIDCVFYNYDEGPQGNPASLNLIGDVWKWGPASRAAGLGDPTRLLWRFTPGGHGAFDTRQDRVVYISDSYPIGFTPQAPSGDDAAVLTSSPRVPPSVASVGSRAAYDLVLAQAGARLPSADAQTQRLIANLRNATGTYYSGAGNPGPNPTW